MINNIEETGKEGDVDVDELFEKANALLKGYTREKGAKKAEEEKPKVPSTEEGPPPQSQEATPTEVSGNVYHVKAIFYPDAQLRGVRAFLILRDLEEIGEVLETKPERSIIEDAPPTLMNWSLRLPQRLLLRR